MSGWQEFAVSDGTGLSKLPDGMPRPSYALGVLGMPGFTAYMGLLDIGKPRAGETVRRCGGHGRGRLGRRANCENHRLPRRRHRGRRGEMQLGRRATGFRRVHRPSFAGPRPAAACGLSSGHRRILRKCQAAGSSGPVLPLLNTHARIPVCGLISQYQDAEPTAPPDFAAALMRAVLVKRITMRGFIIFDDYGPRFAEFRDAMAAWLREGRIRYREDVVDGLVNAPAAFIGLLAGRNFGKLVVKVGM